MVETDWCDLCESILVAGRRLYQSVGFEDWDEPLLMASQAKDGKVSLQPGETRQGRALD